MEGLWWLWWSLGVFWLAKKRRNSVHGSSFGQRCCYGNRLFLSDGQGEKQTQVQSSMYVPCFWISLDIGSNLCTFPEFDGLGAKHVQKVRAPRFDLHADRLQRWENDEFKKAKKRKSSGETSFFLVTLQNLHFDLVASPSSHLPEAIGDAVHCKAPPQCFDLCG